MTCLAEQIVASARSWIGTEFHHQGRLKRTGAHRGGVDCLGLLVGVARELGLRGRSGEWLCTSDELAYGHYPDGIRLRSKLGELLEEIEIAQIQPGDIALFAIDNTPRHLGIISRLDNGLGLIHAYAPARKVVECNLGEEWRGRLRTGFRLIGA